METLPTEIVEQIFYYLSNSSLFYCALVNKSWNTIVTPLLYGTVILSDHKKKLLFFDTIYCPLQRHSIHPLIREIHVLEYYSMEGEFEPDVLGSKYSLDILSALPNLEIMIEYDFEKPLNDGYASIIQEELPITCSQTDFIDDKLITTARNLKEMKFMDTICERQDSINGIIITARSEKSFRGFSGIADYLQLFPQINYLIVDYKHTLYNPNAIFNQILTHCSKLRYIFYGPGLTENQLLDSPNYPDLTKLHLSVQHLSTSHIKYIKSIFTEISALKLVINNTTYNRDVIDTLLRTFQNVHSVEWAFNNYYTLIEIRDMLDDFWTLGHIDNIIQDPDRKLRFVIQWRGALSSGASRLGFGIKGHYYMFNRTVEVCIAEPALFGIFEDYGQKIFNLSVYDYPEVIHLEVVNEVFPNLRSLNLHDTLFISDCENLPNSIPCLTELSLPSLCINNQMADLRLMYPKVTRLNIRNLVCYISQSDYDYTEEMYIIDISWNELQHLHIGTISAPSSIKTIAIERLRRGPKKKAWVYDTERETLTQETRPRLFFRKVKKPLLVLRSRSITKVKIDCELIIKDETF